MHAYRLHAAPDAHSLQFDQALSTDAEGVKAALGIKVEPRVELDVMHAAINAKLSDRTLLTY